MIKLPMCLGTIHTNNDVEGWHYHLHITEIFDSPNFRWDKPLTSDEFYAFISRNLAAGVQKSRNEQLMEYWSFLTQC